MCLSVPVLTVCFVTGGLRGVLSVKEQAGERLMCAGQGQESVAHDSASESSLCSNIYSALYACGSAAEEVVF